MREKPAKATETQGTSRPKKKMPNLVGKARTMAKDIWQEDQSEIGRLYKEFRRFIRFLIVSFEKFMRDEAMMRATSISYSIIVSFVPTLVVVMLLGAKFINLEEYFAMATEFIRKNGIPLDPEPYFQVIKELLHNAGKIGGIGFLVMLFSATTVLRNIENALNRIWRVQKDRPMLQKLSGFVMVMIFGPVLLTLGISYAQMLLNQFASPELNKITQTQSGYAIMGEKNVLSFSKDGEQWKSEKIVQKIDFDYDNRSVVFSPSENKVLSSEDLEALQSQPTAIEKGAIKQDVFVDYLESGKRKFLVGKNGHLIFSRDNGQTWSVRTFAKEENGWLQNATLNRIYFFSESRGVLIGNKGLILKTNDAGESWEPDYQTTVTNNLNDITSLGSGRYAIVGDRFTSLISTDSGQTWESWAALADPNSQKPRNITSISSFRQTILVTGESGLLMLSRDSGENWTAFQMRKNYDFSTSAILDETHMLVAGNSGRVRVSKVNSEDNAVHWMDIDSTTGVDLTKAIADVKKGKFFLVGENYTILSNPVAIGNKDISEMKLKVIEKAPFWRKLISALGNIVLPFIVIWILFFLLYRIIPYTDVSLKAASIGAATTSLIWVLFLLSFKIYVGAFSSGTFAIYGTLAAIPLALLLIYVSSMIILYGAEVSFLVQYPAIIRLRGKKLRNELEKRQIWYGLDILYRLSSNFLKGKGSVPEKDLVKACNNDHEEFSFIMKKLDSLKLAEATGQNSYILARPPQEIRLRELIDILDPSDFEIPSYSEKNSFMKETRKVFDGIVNARTKVYEDLTFADLIKGEFR